MNGDLISRNALLSKMFPYGMPDGGNYGINARAVRDAVVTAKAVEAEPMVHAHWERFSSCGDGYDMMRCSACGAIYENWSGLWNGCPNCLAHMDEEVADD